MKKFKVLVICFCLIIPFSVSAFAADGRTPDAEIQAETYDNASAYLSVSEGKVTAIGELMGKTGVTTKISVHLYLQQYQSKGWAAIADWQASKSAASYVFAKTKSVSQGHKYRVKAVFTVYAGSKRETATRYSSELSY